MAFFISKQIPKHASYPTASATKKQKAVLKRTALSDANKTKLLKKKSTSPDTQ